MSRPPAPDATPGHPAVGRSAATPVLATLAIAQFLMVLDTSVMNVSITRLVENFDTTVTTIQGVITLYSLVMAMLMLAGAKVGDIIGRRRAFVIGLVVYGIGSLMTALAPDLIVLALGWSILEGIGAALVLPALVALLASNFEGDARRRAYGVIAGVAGAGIAVGPILGGWATTQLSWRVVFAGEVVVVVVILAMARVIQDAPRAGRPPRLDLVGVLLSAGGLGMVVLATLQSSVWGWFAPKNPPFEIFEMAPTLYVIAAGLACLWAFVVWQRRRERRGGDPLVHLRLLGVPPLRAGLLGMVSSNMMLMGVFFVVPLYLQLVLGLDALETGIRVLPVSAAMFVMSFVGVRLSSRFSSRTLVRAGLVVAMAAIVVLLATVEPTLDDLAFAAAMALLGVGMGLMASQLSNVAQAAVGEADRSEAGGLQNTGEQLGSALGVALIGSIALTFLTGIFLTNVQADRRIAPEVVTQVGIAAGTGVDFVPSSQIGDAARDAGVSGEVAAAVADSYATAQLLALRVGLLAAGVLALLSLMGTRELPHARPPRSGRVRARAPARKERRPEAV